MTQGLDDVWTARDLPVLTAVGRLLEAGAEYLFEHPISEETGLDRDAVIRSITVLRNAGFIEAQLLEGAGGVLSATVTGITERGMRTVGLWPSPEAAADRVLVALEKALDEAPEGSAKHSRLRAIRDGFIGLGRDLTVEIAGAAITGRLPL